MSGELIIQDILTGNNLLPITKVRNWISTVTGMLIYPSMRGTEVVLEYVDPSDGSLIMTVYIAKTSAFKTKYKGLDMFNNEGYPLTTYEDIRARRRKLIPKYV